MDHVPVSVKFLVIAVGAMLTTVLCFLIMQFLVTVSIERAPELEPPRLSAPVMPSIRDFERREVRSQPMRYMPSEPPPAPDGIPIAPEEMTVLVKSPRPTLGSIAQIMQEGDFEFDLQPPLRDLVPLFVVQPVYPFKAVMREIEGFVVVNFSVRENGTVVNPVVIESEPGTLFDEAALSAISKFRFQPRLVGGDPVPVSNLQLKFLFKLDTSELSTGSTGPLIERSMPVDNESAPR